MDMLPHLFYDIFRCDDLCCGTKSGNPCEELRTHHNICTYGEVIIPIADNEDISTQTIQHSSNQMILKPELNLLLIAGEHTKHLSCMGQIISIKTSGGMDMLKETPAPVKNTFRKYVLLYTAITVFGLIWGLLTKDSVLLLLSASIAALGAGRTMQNGQPCIHTGIAHF